MPAIIEIGAYPAGWHTYSWAGVYCARAPLENLRLYSIGYVAGVYVEDFASITISSPDDENLYVAYEDYDSSWGEPVWLVPHGERIRLQSDIRQEPQGLTCVHAWWWRVPEYDDEWHEVDGETATFVMDKEKWWRSVWTCDVPVATNTPTPTIIPTNTPTNSPTVAPTTVTNTPESTQTPTSMPSRETETPTPTPTPTMEMTAPTSTPTSTAVALPTPSLTPTPITSGDTLKIYLPIGK